MKNTTGVHSYADSSVQITTSSEESINGDFSFKFFYGGNLWSFGDFLLNDFTLGSKLKVTMNILTPYPIALAIYKVGSSTSKTLSQVTIPALNEWGVYSLTSTEIPSDTTLLRIRLLQASSNHYSIFIDNIMFEEI